MHLGVSCYLLLEGGGSGGETLLGRRLQREAADDRKRQRALALEREVLLVSLRTWEGRVWEGNPSKRDGGMAGSALPPKTRVLTNVQRFGLILGT